MDMQPLSVVHSSVVWTVAHQTVHTHTDRQTDR